MNVDAKLEAVGFNSKARAKFFNRVLALAPLLQGLRHAMASVNRKLTYRVMKGAHRPPKCLLTLPQLGKRNASARVLRVARSQQSMGFIPRHMLISGILLSLHFLD